MHRMRQAVLYQLQVVKKGEDPKWDRPDSDLVVGNQDIGNGYIQYWAYPKDSQKEAEDVPPAEELAIKNSSATPAIIIDQPGDPDTTIQLVLAKDGHAWAKTDAEIETLEDNISNLVDAAKREFDFEVEHFMATPSVSPEVNAKLDRLEESKSEDASINASVGEDVDPNNEPSESEEESFSPPPINAQGSIGLGGGASNQIRMGSDQFPASGVYVSQNRSSKLWTVILLVILLGMIGGGYYFKDQILSKIGVKLPGSGSEEVALEPTPTPQPTPESSPSPTPVALDRSKYTLKVLNGTSKSGAATELSDSLKELGWKVSSVGNAGSVDTPQTLVKIKKGQDDLGKVLVDDLKEYYEASVSADLDKNSTLDAEVVIGKK